MVRWPTWAWVAGGWIWVAHAVWQADGGGLTAPSAQASLAPAGDALEAAWEPPVPAYHPEPLPPAAAPPSESAAQMKWLRERGGEWEFLTDPLRQSLDAAALHSPKRKAGWRQVVVEGTGEAAGSAKDVTFARRRDDGRVPAPHFVVGNGSRSGDGVIEPTGRPLDGEQLVVSLVGDFSRRAPTASQLRALTEFVDYARAKTGMIPVRMGEASRAPVAGATLDVAYNAGLPVLPDPSPEPR